MGLGTLPNLCTRAHASACWNAQPARKAFHCPPTTTTTSDVEAERCRAAATIRSAQATVHSAQGWIPSMRC